MNNLKIEGTQSSPSVCADPEAGVLEMRGDSYPENAHELFSPVLDWIERYLKQTERALTLKLHLLYLNTSSVKAMMDMFDLIEEAHRAGRAVAVNWYYDEQNERVVELAQEFKEDITFPFQISCQVN
jgi:hypothetical protein